MDLKSALDETLRGISDRRPGGWDRELHALGWRLQGWSVRNVEHDATLEGNFFAVPFQGKSDVVFNLTHDQYGVKKIEKTLAFSGLVFLHDNGAFIVDSVKLSAPETTSEESVNCPTAS